jgi:hypothetical protein
MGKGVAYVYSFIYLLVGNYEPHRQSPHIVQSIGKSLSESPVSESVSSTFSKFSFEQIGFVRSFANFIQHNHRQSLSPNSLVDTFERPFRVLQLHVAQIITSYQFSSTQPRYRADDGNRPACLILRISFCGYPAILYAFRIFFYVCLSINGQSP